MPFGRYPCGFVTAYSSAATPTFVPASFIDNSLFTALTAIFMLTFYLPLLIYHIKFPSLHLRADSRILMRHTEGLSDELAKIKIEAALILLAR